MWEFWLILILFLLVLLAILCCYCILAKKYVWCYRNRSMGRRTFAPPEPTNLYGRPARDSGLPKPLPPASPHRPVSAGYAYDPPAPPNPTSSMRYKGSTHNLLAASGELGGTDGSMSPIPPPLPAGKRMVGLHALANMQRKAAAARRPGHRSAGNSRSARRARSRRYNNNTNGADDRLAPTLRVHQSVYTD